MTSPETLCPLCDAPIPHDALEGLCPWCLYEGVETSPGVSSPGSIGGYPIRGVLGQGAFAIVYLAHHPALGRDVALKVSKQRFAEGAELARLRQELERLTQLELPNVVRVYASGVEEGHLWLSMPALHGGTLRQRMQAPIEPSSAAALLVTIARAVHALHTQARGQLPLNLEPENILFDQHGAPFVSDLGIWSPARAGDTRAARLARAAYAAPERAFLEPGELTPASDVYGLGVLFYELLTGSLPHPGDTPEEILRDMALRAPVAPRRIVPELDRDLEAVCLHALLPAEARYPSAAAFADDLENALSHRPLLVRRSSLLDRTLRWARRHPAPSAALAVTALLGLGVFTSMRSVAREQTAVLEQVASTNAFSASARAGAALVQLVDHAGQLSTAARDPALRALVASDGPPEGSAAALAPHARGFDGLLVLDAAARLRGRWPEDAASPPAGDAQARDYLTGAYHLARHCPARAYLAPAFRDAESGELALALSTPLMDAERGWAGVLVGVVQVGSAFGDVALLDPERGRLTAWLGPRERHPPEPPALAHLAHDGSAERAELAVPESTARELERRFGGRGSPCEQLELHGAPPLTLLDHHDPVPGFGGRWLAAVAPVGRTGFFVVVQTRHPEAPDAAAEHGARLAPDMALGP